MVHTAKLFVTGNRSLVTSSCLSHCCAHVRAPMELLPHRQSQTGTHNPMDSTKPTKSQTASLEQQITNVKLGVCACVHVCVSKIKHNAANQKCYLDETSVKMKTDFYGLNHSLLPSCPQER